MLEVFKPLSLSLSSHAIFYFIVMNNFATVLCVSGFSESCSSRAAVSKINDNMSFDFYKFNYRHWRRSSSAITDALMRNVKNHVT